MKYRHAIFIGRFQPFHNGHLAVVKHALSIAHNVTIICGSSGRAPSIKNPFSFVERSHMILNSLSTEDRYRVHCAGVRDYFDSDEHWVANVRSLTSHIKWTDPCCLVGNYKDVSSFYLRLFGDMKFEPSIPTEHSATPLRDMLFDQKVTTSWADKGIEVSGADLSRIRPHVPQSTMDELEMFVKTERYANLVQEYDCIKKYKKSWANSPFPPVFVTADAVVICMDHVLLVKRKFHPGKDLWALPGGFVNQDERVFDACLRELREETGIRLEREQLVKSLVDEHVFDHPGRSLRGRTITHAFHFDIDQIRLLGTSFPSIEAADDAAEVRWMPARDVLAYEDQFFDDHAHIITHFLRR